MQRENLGLTIAIVLSAAFWFCAYLNSPSGWNLLWSIIAAVLMSLAFTFLGLIVRDIC